MYLIHKNSIELNCTKEPLGKQFKTDINQVLELEFYPRLEKLLLQYDDADTIWLIDDLPIVLNDLSSKYWKTEFVDQSMLQIESFLKEYLPMKRRVDEEKPTAKSGWKMDKKERAKQLIIKFLETGIIETNIQATVLSTLYNDIEIDKHFVKKMKTVLKDEIRMILRWSLNLPRHFKFKFLEADGITHDFDFAVKAIDRSPQLNDFLEFLYWIAYFNEESSMLSQHFMTRIKRIAEEYYNIESSYVDKLLYQNDESDSSIIKPVALNTSVDEELFEGINFSHKEINTNENNKLFDQDKVLFVENAGLVLLHPFLPKLFSELGYQENGIWKDVLSQHRAVLVLQYLVGFEEVIFENQLILNKLFCGVNPIDTVQTKFEASQIEIRVCQDLLQSVINHWTILKNTSVSGLQESFIKRSGKLALREDEHYELTVENKSYDLLLDQLPWGIGMIKTPWMEDYLICNWN
ncbi:contractile injection system tape measure protein [uncultured Psychroserpens sp.]|uniref:contractile injection system tape measure protein n=1 Tax=uncultured Psychroserpens sp. TaxID=255436 RepID=UPI00260A30B9|nr:contractile injection system tape measure protein [uncultured Psychroserpens sp.]